MMGRTFAEKISVRGDILVVPPFECAWVSNGEDGDRAGGASTSAESGFCLAFESRAERDVTLILNRRELAGGKRVRSRGSGYTIIIGSHCNSRLVIERDAKIVWSIPGVSCSKAEFKSFWVDFKW